MLASASVYLRRAEDTARDTRFPLIFARKREAGNGDSGSRTRYTYVRRVRDLCAREKRQQSIFLPLVHPASSPFLRRNVSREAACALRGCIAGPPPHGSVTINHGPIKRVLSKRPMAVSAVRFADLNGYFPVSQAPPPPRPSATGRCGDGRRRRVNLSFTITPVARFTTRGASQFRYRCRVARRDTLRVAETRNRYYCSIRWWSVRAASLLSRS